MQSAQREYCENLNLINKFPRATFWVHMSQSCTIIQIAPLELPWNHSFPCCLCVYIKVQEKEEERKILSSLRALRKRCKWREIIKFIVVLSLTLLLCMLPTTTCWLWNIFIYLCNKITPPASPPHVSASEKGECLFSGVHKHCVDWNIMTRRIKYSIITYGYEYICTNA